MESRIKTALFLSLVWSSGAYGADIIMHKGTTVTVTVNSAVGTVLEFPAVVQLTVPTKKFKVNKIATTIDKKTRQAINIRFFSVKPTVAGAVDTMTFIFPNKRSVKVRLIAKRGADKHHRFLFPHRKQGVPWANDSFLDKEISLVVAMLKDEAGNGFDRQKIYQNLRIEGANGIDLILVRRFQGRGLLGYTFKLINTGKEAIVVNPAALNFDFPNKAVLFHIDHFRLEPCSENNSSDPKSNSCMAAVRVVVRGDSYVLPASTRDLPFKVKRG